MTRTVCHAQSYQRSYRDPDDGTYAKHVYIAVAVLVREKILDRVRRGRRECTVAGTAAPACRAVGERKGEKKAPLRYIIT